MSAWIQTYTGRQFDYLSDAPDVHIEDIAQGLSNQSRYAGQCKHFYSVAQHTVLGTRVALEQGNLDLAKCFFLHDASEAYLVDVPRPIKLHLTGYTDIEDKLQSYIYRFFGVTEETVGVCKEDTKTIDMRILITEKNQLFAKYYPWTMEEQFPAYDNIKISEWSPKKARKEFMKLHEQLFEGTVQCPVFNTPFLFDPVSGRV